MKWYHYCASDLGFSAALPGYNSCHCQVLPSEYAYLQESVYHSESMSANCRNYPPGNEDKSIHQEDYIHCNGTTLTLTDSDIGLEQYTHSHYYVWLAGSRSSQLLFIFPTRVNLTTITLHYYSDSIRALPRLRFWVVPDNFNIWDAPTSSYNHVDVAAVSTGGESAGRKNINVHVTTITKEILLYNYRNSFPFALSEVEFFDDYCFSSCKYNN